MNVGRPDTAATADVEVDRTTRGLRLALVLCGFVARIGGQFAGDYRDALHSGFPIHQWRGKVVSWNCLALHGGAVVAHSLTGHPLWQRMFFPAVTRKMAP